MPKWNGQSPFVSRFLVFKYLLYGMWPPFPRTSKADGWVLNVKCTHLAHMLEHVAPSWLSGKADKSSGSESREASLEAV